MRFTPMSTQTIPPELRSTAEHLIGKKVLIVGDHPHADRVGIVNGLRRTAAGWGFEVTFTDNTAASGGCFVFEQKHWKVLDPKGPLTEHSLRDLITDFLARYGLSEAYINNLPKTDQCVGCSRDGGDHDGECPADNPEMWEGSTGHATTNASYEDQVATLMKWFKIK